MRRKQSSLSASGIAIVRAVESEKPEDARLCHDPYARFFVPTWLYILTAFFIRSGYAERRGPGVWGYLAVRERYIDDVLQEQLNQGLEQLVILGAGYDSRAYRFKGLIEQVKVFEVDHPATQADKLKKLAGILEDLPPYVTYVSVDFNTQSMEECLLESGFSSELKTLFIWQGVSMYLTPDAVDATLRFVTRHSAPGSAIIFDYLERQVLEGVERHGEVINMRRYRFMSGEELTYAIDKDKLESFLKERGFCSIQNMNALELKKIYFTGKNAGRNIASGYGIVLAFV
ncbi:MAG: SAM-dependent methyltransferase [Anaerolineaceae bacterium]